MFLRSNGDLINNAPPPSLASWLTFPTFPRSVTRKLVSYMSDLVTDKSQLQELLALSENRPVDKYLQSFEWDTARYNTKLSIRELAEIISQQVTKVETEMKGRVSLYQKVKSNLQAIERKTTYVFGVLTHPLCCARVLQTACRVCGVHTHRPRADARFTSHRDKSSSHPIMPSNRL